MKKTIMTLLLSLAAVLNINAYDTKINNIYYNLDHTNYTAEVTYYDLNNNSNAYRGKVIIPSTISYNDKTYNVTTIGPKAFFGCQSLVSVSISNSVTSIREYAFYSTSLQSIYIGNSVKTIEAQAFRYCSKLTSVTMGNSLTTIETGAFESCEGLTSITIPNSVKTIGARAFEKCSSLRFVTLGESVVEIRYAAFVNCSSLGSITIPNSVKYIEESVFTNCSSLVYVSLGASIENIQTTFYNCTNLSDISIKSAVPPNFVLSTQIDTQNIRLHVPVGSKDSYASANGWSDFKNIIEDIYDNEQLKGQIATLTQENEALTQEVATLTQANENLMQENDNLIQEWDNLTTEVANLNKENHRLTQANLTQRRLLSIKETENEALRLRLETGDMDGNGVTTAADVAKVVQAALTQTEPQVTEE